MQGTTVKSYKIPVFRLPTYRMIIPWPSVSRFILQNIHAKQLCDMYLNIRCQVQLVAKWYSFTAKPKHLMS